jgi:hypothetical protein
LRARPEQTQSEDLTDASFLSRLLVLPANVRLDWKVIARYKHFSLFGLVFCNKEKKFYDIDVQVISDVQRKEDAATYTCTARNDEGYSARSDLEVSVMGRKTFSSYFYIYTDILRKYGYVGTHASEYAFTCVFMNKYAYNMSTWLY